METAYTKVVQFIYKVTNFCPYVFEKSLKSQKRTAVIRYGATNM